MESSPSRVQLINIKDEKVFEQIFREHYSVLAGFALKYLHDPDLSEEIVQEMFSNLWIKSDVIEVRTSIKSYLYGAVRNACLNYIKHQKIEEKYADHVKLTISSVKETDFLELDELQQRIAEAMDKIPDKCREIFELSRYEGKKYKEIAEELGLSQKTVENQMGKALRILRDELGDYLPALWWLIFFYGGKI